MNFPPQILQTRKLRRVVGVALFSILALCFLGVAISWQYAHPLPDEDEIFRAIDEAVQASQLHSGRRRVPLGELPPYVVTAFLAAEDARFFEHDGVDTRAVIRAALHLASSEVQGASTLTMQLARNLFLHDRPRGIRRKVAEWRLARHLESILTKNQILETYLNVIYFGADQWGIDAAARFYFHKPAAAVSLEEAATLAALPKAPALLRPDKPENSVRLAVRRNWVNARIRSMPGAGENPFSVSQEGERVKSNW